MNNVLALPNGLTTATGIEEKYEPLNLALDGEMGAPAPGRIKEEPADWAVQDRVDVPELFECKEDMVDVPELFECKEDRVDVPELFECKEDRVDVPELFECKEEWVDTSVAETNAHDSVANNFPIETVFVKVEAVDIPDVSEPECDQDEAMEQYPLGSRDPFLDRGAVSEFEEDAWTDASSPQTKDVKVSLSAPVLMQHHDARKPQVQTSAVAVTDPLQSHEVAAGSSGTGDTVTTRCLYSCSACPATFFQEGDLGRHKQSHLKCRIAERKGWPASDARPFTCPDCNRCFAKNSQLSIHSRVHTNEKPFACDVCDKRFHWSTSLTVHRRTHTGEKGFRCPTCSMSFTSKSNLAQHRLVHTGEKPFGCESCPKSFSQNSQLTIHRRTHTGEKPFACRMCPKNFTSQSHLTKHVRIHTDEKPFTCRPCGKSFHWSYSLTVHKCGSEDRKQFRCETCNTMFKTKRQLTEHQVNHEPRTPS